MQEGIIREPASACKAASDASQQERQEAEGLQLAATAFMAGLAGGTQPQAERVKEVIERTKEELNQLDVEASPVEASGACHTACYDNRLRLYFQTGSDFEAAQQAAAQPGRKPLRHTVVVLVGLGAGEQPVSSTVVALQGHGVGLVAGGGSGACYLSAQLRPLAELGLVGVAAGGALLVITAPEADIEPARACKAASNKKRGKRNPQ